MKSHAFKYLSSTCRCNSSPGVRCNPTNQERTGTSSGKEKKMKLAESRFGDADQSDGEQPRTSSKYGRVLIEIFRAFLFYIPPFFFFSSNLLDCKYATTFHWRTLNAGRFYCALDEGTIFQSHPPTPKKKIKAQN